MVLDIQLIAFQRPTRLPYRTTAIPMNLNLNRRDFVKAGTLALGAASIPPSLWAAQQPLLPTVRWGKHAITRLLLGHNPLKGVSHQTEKLSREMKDYLVLMKI